MMSSRARLNRVFSLFRQQPPVFSAIFSLEIAERFGFYTVQGILTLYFIRKMDMSEVEAYEVVGAFYAMLYGLIAIGGYVGDRILGAYRTIGLGLIVMIFGYFALSVAGPKTLYIALGLICVGNAIFKANPSTLLSSAYHPGDTRIHSGFTLYYMVVNIGAFIALLVGPYAVTHHGYMFAYGLSALGLCLAFGIYWSKRACLKAIHRPEEPQSVSFFQWVIVLCCTGILTFVCAYLLIQTTLARVMLYTVMFVGLILYLKRSLRESANVRRQMWLVIVLMGEAVIFFILYQQMPTSMNLFAVYHVKPFLFGIPVDPQSFQVLNPFWICLLSPILAMIYQYWPYGKFGSIPYKFAFGMLSAGFAFLLLSLAQFFHNDANMVSSWWLVGCNFFLSLGELLISALGIAMVAELVPKDMTGFVMGMWFLVTALSGFLGASVASFSALPKHIHPSHATLLVYTHVFAWIGVITMGVGVVLWIIAKPLDRALKASL